MDCKTSASDKKMEYAREEILVSAVAAGSLAGTVAEGQSSAKGGGIGPKKRQQREEDGGGGEPLRTRP